MNYARNNREAKEASKRLEPGKALLEKLEARSEQIYAPSKKLYDQSNLPPNRASFSEHINPRF